MKKNKCESGYILAEKKRRIMVTLIYVIIGVAIFLTGFFMYNHSKSNVFTVVAILLVLPAAKHFVQLIILMPFHSVEKKEEEEIRSLREDAEFFFDYVFTSEEKVMGLKAAVISNGNFVGLSANEKQDIPYIKSYLQKGANNYSPNFQVYIEKDKHAFEKKIKALKERDITDNQNKAVLDWLKSLAV